MGSARHRWRDLKGHDMADQSLPYEKVAPNAYTWTERAYDALVAGRMSAGIRTLSNVSTANVAGPCPRCEHPVDYSVILDVVTGERVGTLGQDGVDVAAATDEYLSIVASCRCGEEHEGRPDGVAHGCGINFTIEIAAT